MGAFCKMRIEDQIMECLTSNSLSRQTLPSNPFHNAGTCAVRGAERRAFCKMRIENRITESPDIESFSRKMIPSSTFTNFVACAVSSTKSKNSSGPECCFQEFKTCRRSYIITSSLKFSRNIEITRFTLRRIMEVLISLPVCAGPEWMGFYSTRTADQIMESSQNLKIDTMSVLDATDPAFVVDPEFRPKNKHNDFVQAMGDQIPCIDLSPLEKDDESTKKLVSEIGKAAEDWGFFEVVNHGVPLSLIETLEKEALAFFSLPLEEKNQSSRSFEHPFGYYHQELTKSRKDWKEVFDFLVKEFTFFPSADGSHEHRIRSQWPEEPVGLREACQKYAQATEKLGFELLRLLSQSLGLAPEYFQKDFTNHTSAIRLNHYPPCPIPDLVLGVGPHKDPNAITILRQDETGGLQVRRKDGEWIGVKPRRNAFVINLGDQFQVWTNKKYRSIEHQVVVNEQKPRLSFAVFMGPDPTTNIYPLPELLQGERPKYSCYNYGFFICQRTAGNIQLEKTIEIDDFEIN